MSIFISIVAYRDALLQFTIDRALTAARHPEAIRFGIVDQSDAPLASAPQTYLHLPPSAARGPCWARALAMSFYAGEEWFLQIDSHSDFDDGWDEILIGQARQNTVLTAYPAPLTFDGDTPVHGDNSAAYVGVVRRDASFPVVMFQATPIKTSAPVHAIHLGACALFAPGSFVQSFPYDPQLYFHGEEQSLFLRLYTHGCDVLHPVTMPIYHKYATDKSRVMHWDHDPRAAALERHSKARIEALLSGADLGVYGLGAARTLADYAKLSGIDYARRTIEPRAYTPRGAASPISWGRSRLPV